MEYRRRKRTRRRNNRNNTGGESAGRMIIGLLLVAGVIYFVSASNAGTWIAQNVMAPMFEAFNPQDSEPSGTADPSVAAGLDLSSGGKTTTEEIPLKPMDCFLLQMGVFSSEANANELAKEIQGKGAGGYVVQDGTQYRVFASGYTTEASAKEVRDRLKSEGTDCTVHKISCAGASFKVTATEAQLKAVREGFKALYDAQEAMVDAALRFDKDSLSVSAGKSNVTSIQDELSGAMKSLIDQKSDASILASVKACYDAFYKDLQSLAQYNTESTVEFSAQMKYTQIKMACEYKDLVEGLSSAD